VLPSDGRLPIIQKANSGGLAIISREWPQAAESGNYRRHFWAGVRQALDCRASGPFYLRRREVKNGKTFQPPNGYGMLRKCYLPAAKPCRDEYWQEKVHTARYLTGP
jgi:hypothetical protein